LIRSFRTRIKKLLSLKRNYKSFLTHTILYPHDNQPACDTSLKFRNYNKSFIIITQTLAKNSVFIGTLLIEARIKNRNKNAQVTQNEEHDRRRAGPVHGAEDAP